MSGEIIIRKAEIGEAKALAGFHVAVWRETYADIAPLTALQTLDAKRRLSAWQEYLTNSHQQVLVAMRHNQIVGLVCFGPPDNPVFGDHVEIRHLYVDPQMKRQGIGRRLLNEGFGQMVKDGFRSAALAVVRENADALNFYKAIGGVEKGSYTDKGPLWKSDNLILVWDRLELL